MTLLVMTAMSAFAIESVRYVDAQLLSTRADMQGPDGFCHIFHVRLGNELYIGTHCAHMPWNVYEASEFVEGGTVHARTEHGHLLLQRPNGKDLKIRVTKRILWNPRWEVPRRRDPDPVMDALLAQ